MAEILNGGSSERMLGLLLAQFEDKPVIRAILELIGEEFDRMSSVRQDIRTQMWPDVAIGKQLDMCGEVADISRKVDKAIAVDFSASPTTAIMGSAWRASGGMASHICRHRSCGMKNTGLLFSAKLPKTQRTEADRARWIVSSACLTFPALLRLTAAMRRCASASGVMLRQTN